MKNLLIATTALVATAGMAAAQANISFSGSGRFGIVYDENTAPTGTADAISAAAAAVAGATTAEAAAVAAVDAEYSANDVVTIGTLNARWIARNNLIQAESALDEIDGETGDEAKLHNRITINIDGTAETESGVEFFGRVRIRGGNEGDPGDDGSTISAPRVGLRAGGFTVAVGNIDGAIDSLKGVYSGGIGLTGLSYSNVANNNSSAGTFKYDSFSSGGAGSNGVEVIYTANGFNGHLSYSASTKRTGLGLSYEFSDWTVALGHQSSDTLGEDFTSLSADGTFGSVSVGAAYAANEGGFDTLRINAGFDVGVATKVAVYIADNDGAGRETAYGVGFTHKLGGATLAGGIENDRAGLTRADFGVRFGF